MYAIRSYYGLGNENRPIGSFLFAGPTGVGKTEVTRQLARIMGQELVRFDMSEYMERHTVSRLIGAPPADDPWQHLIQARGYRLIGEHDQAEQELAAAIPVARDDSDASYNFV